MYGGAWRARVSQSYGTLKYWQQLFLGLGCLLFYFIAGTNKVFFFLGGIFCATFYAEGSSLLWWRYSII